MEKGLSNYSDSLLGIKESGWYRNDPHRCELVGCLAIYRNFVEEQILKFMETELGSQVLIKSLD